MFVDFLILIAGLVFLIKGADKLIDGSASIAKKFGLSGLVIGLTIIAFGTSAPELMVNILSSLRGNSDIGMGNIIGSNIANILLILGVTAAISSIEVHDSITRKQIPFSVLAVVALFILTNTAFFDGGSAPSVLNRSGGLILLLFFIIFLYYTFSIAKNKDKDKGEEEIKVYKNWQAFFFVIFGIIALFVGGRFIVDSASNIARSFGLSEALIGLTIVAVGTSLPELAASIAAARKKQADMAIGNVIGSNIFNILFVLGLSSIIRPLNYSPMLNFDIFFLIYISILLIPLIYAGKKKCFTRAKGIALLIIYLAYLIFISVRG